MGWCCSLHHTGVPLMILIQYADFDLLYHEKLVMADIYGFAGKMNQILSQFNFFICDCILTYVQVNHENDCWFFTANRSFQELGQQF